jgi:hypothetical protein
MSRRLSGLALAFFIAAAMPVAALTPAEKAKCENIKAEEVINAAILRLVQAGQSFSKRPPDEVNPLPYSSLAEFKSANPDCCEILTRIPSDFPLRIQKLGRPIEGGARAFAVALRYLKYTPKGPHQRYETYLVDCLGEQVTETKLLLKMED